MSSDTTSSTESLLEAKGITKSFERNTVLSDVDIEIRHGEVHAVVGENGAGKSTLMKILGGDYSADSGSVFIAGEQLRLRSPRDAIERGIVVIHQEFSLTPHLSAEENIFLGHYPRTRFGTVDYRSIRQQTLQLLERLSVRVDPGRLVGELSVAQQQMVEIAKALSLDAQVLILDEPTAVLDEDNVDTLFEVLRRLKAQGIGIIYISHHLEEVFEIADRVTVLRDGKKTGSSAVADIDHNWLVSRMIGREFPQHHTQQQKYGEKALEIESLSIDGLFRNITFSVREGEIIGLAGLVGAGRSEIAQSIFGLRRLDAGEVRVFGTSRRIRTPNDATKLGIAYVTEDRKAQGLFLNRPVFENITMSNLFDFYEFPFLSLKKEKSFARSMVETLDIRLPNVRTEIRTLSGGNQQKVLIARALAVKPKILILDEPTRGVDIGAKQEIYRFIERLIGEGIAIILISSEMEEILRLSDQIIVLREGQIADRLSREEASEEAIMKAAALASADSSITTLSSPTE